MAEETKVEEKKSITPKPKSYTPFLNFFAFWIMSWIFAYIAAITFIPVPKENIRFADTCIGFLLGVVVMGIMTWGFRSSKAQIDKEIKQLNGGGADEPKV